MATQTITIRVSPEAARVYNTATAEQQRKLEALLSLLASRQIPVHYDVTDFEEDLATLQRLGRL